MDDIQFRKALRDYLAQFSEGEEPETPLFVDSSGAIDRAKTLGLPCYAGFHLAE